MRSPLIEIIETVENEIGTYYQGGAIRWADENFDGAWSAAMDRFERALVIFGQGGSQEQINDEARIYKVTILEFIRLYKERRADRKARTFFEELKERQKSIK